METGNLTIMFTDIKGYTASTSRQTREEQLALVREQRTLVKPTVEALGGQIIKGIGDAFLIVFASPTNAVLAGIRLQEIYRAANAGKAADDQVEIRIAINTGEVAIEENDIYGEAVNIAARIEGIAEPNEVYFTEATYLVMNKNEVPTAEIGYRVLKGIPEKIKVYKVLMEGVARRDRGATPVATEPSVASGIGTAPLAVWWRRGVAFLIDFVIIALVAIALPPHNGKPFWLLWHLSTIICVWRWQRTPGKRLLGLRIVRVDGRPVGLVTAGLRSLALWVSLLPFGLGFLWSLWDPKRQCFHDKLAETIVIGPTGSGR